MAGAEEIPAEEKLEEKAVEIAAVVLVVAVEGIPVVVAAFLLNA